MEHCDKWRKRTESLSDFERLKPQNKAVGDWDIPDTGHSRLPRFDENGNWSYDDDDFSDEDDEPTNWDDKGDSLDGRSQNHKAF